MPGLCRVKLDTFGKTGVITGPGSVTTKADMLPASLVGDLIASHGEPPHAAAKVTKGSACCIIDGRPATIQTLSIASCAHPADVKPASVQIGY